MTKYLGIKTSPASDSVRQTGLDHLTHYAMQAHLRISASSRGGKHGNALKSQIILCAPRHSIQQPGSTRIMSATCRSLVSVKAMSIEVPVTASNDGLVSAFKQPWSCSNM